MEKNECSASVDEWYNVLPCSTKYGDPVKEFNLIITAERLKQIERRDGKRYVPWQEQKSELAYLIAETMWKRFQIPCNFLLNLDIVNDDYITVAGTCFECCSALEGRAKIANEQDVIFDCTLRIDKDRFLHLKQKIKWINTKNDSRDQNSSAYGSEETTVPFVNFKGSSADIAPDNRTRSGEKVPAEGACASSAEPVSLFLNGSHFGALPSEKNSNTARGFSNQTATDTDVSRLHPSAIGNQSLNFKQPGEEQSLTTGRSEKNDFHRNVMEYSTEGFTEANFKKLKACIEQDLPLDVSADIWKYDADDFLGQPVNLFNNDDSFQPILDDHRPETLGTTSSVQNTTTDNASNCEAYRNAIDDLQLQMSKCLDVSSPELTNEPTYPVLQNGCALPPLGPIESFTKVRVINTCAFDALIGLLMQGVCTSKPFKELLQQSDVHTAKYVTEILETDRIDDDSYVDRYYILRTLEFLKHDLSSTNVFKLDARCNISELYELLFVNMPFLTTNTFCEKCNDSRWTWSNQISLNIHILFSKGYNFVQSAFDDLNGVQFAESTCKVCRKPVLACKEYGAYLVFDVSLSTCPEYKKVFPEEVRKKCVLGTVTKRLRIGGKSYHLAGIAHYDSVYPIGKGHYAAYLLHKDKWFIYDDLKPTIAQTDRYTVICPHIMLYVQVE